MTIYFADEVPLTLNQSHHISDSAPLLDDPEKNRTALSMSNSDAPLVTSANGNTDERGHERDVKVKDINAKMEDNQDESFNDGPGAVLVNFLTSLRHLPPAMHSVLVVMALSWVGLYWCLLMLYDNNVLN